MFYCVDSCTGLTFENTPVCIFCVFNLSAILCIQDHLIVRSNLIYHFSEKVMTLVKIMHNIMCYVLVAGSA